MTAKNRKSDPRWTVQYRRKREALKRRAKLLNLPCAICRGALGPIDFDAPKNTPLAFTAEHVVPVSFYADPEAELVPAHAFCNSSKGNRQVKREPNTETTTNAFDDEWFN